MQYCEENPCDLKTKAKISARKLILSELRLHFNRKCKNIESKRFWLRQTFMKSNSKEGFHIFVKEQKQLTKSYVLDISDKIKEHFIVLTNLTFHHFCLYLYLSLSTCDVK